MTVYLDSSVTMDRTDPCLRVGHCALAEGLECLDPAADDHPEEPDHPRGEDRV